ncbi:MAG: transglutaminase-like domain-containing protein [Planctomycetota bacterium]
MLASQEPGGLNDVMGGGGAMSGIRSSDQGGVTSRIRALIKLLGDESPTVFRAARAHLRGLGERARPFVERASVESDDSRTRVRARELLVGFERRDVLEEWDDFCRGEKDLEKGALLLARVENPNFSDSDATRRLDEYAEILRARLTTARSTRVAVRRASQLLGRELGFAGDSEDYANPESSFLHRVLETKRGLPILLSSVYLCVARRASLPLEGVGLPLHFLLRYPIGSKFAFLDPFHAGKEVSARDCRKLLEQHGIQFRDAFLRRVHDQEILSRILGNLLRLYHSKGDQERVGRTLEMLRSLDREASPAVPELGTPAGDERERS